jgi:hypothetical protein
MSERIMPTRVLVPTGALGITFDRKALSRGVAARPDIIAVDGGSTDSGPFSLGSGTSKYSRAATKSEWRDLMLARAEAGVPLVIGTAGTCGADRTVDWMFDITRELADELRQHVKVARLYSSQTSASIEKALGEGRISPLSPTPEISPQTLGVMSNIVALAGAEQVQAALETEADIVIAGRTTDTAIISALPIARGEHPVRHGTAPRSANAVHFAPPIRPVGSFFSNSIDTDSPSSRSSRTRAARRIRFRRICFMRTLIPSSCTSRVVTST